MTGMRQGCRKGHLLAKREYDEEQEPRRELEKANRKTDHREQVREVEDQLRSVREQERERNKRNTARAPPSGIASPGPAPRAQSDSLRPEPVTMTTQGPACRPRWLTDIEGLAPRGRH